MNNTQIVATTLDDVLHHLEKIIQYSKRTNDRAGYFAALYHKVTVKVKEGVDNKQFANGDTLAKLDIMFANRYFEAYSKSKNGEWVSKSWTIVFKNCKLPSRLVLQHLLLGMNAHINFDLGIASAEASKGQIDKLKNDFDSINSILGALTNKVINELNMISPSLSFLGLNGTKSNFMLIQFSMENARDGSWCFAEALSRVYDDKEKYQKLIDERDIEVAELGESLTKTTGFLTLGLWISYI